MCNNKVLILSFYAIASLLVSSCSKTGPTGPRGNTGPSFTGTITGYVTLYDKYGSQVLTGLDSVRLSISGSAIVSTPATYSSANGFYKYTSVSTGTYSIVATDTSSHVLYGSTQINNINFVAGTLNQDIKLSARPDSFITSFASYTKTASANDSLIINASADTRPRNCLVFVSKNLSNPYLLHYIVPITAGSTTATVLIPRQDLLNAGFTSGNTVYYSAYSYVINDVSVYENPATGQLVFTSINPMPIVDSAIVP